MSRRILSLDGGGPWALIQVKALINLYTPQTLGHDVLRDFDLVAANSGGSIVLGGLVENYPLAHILSLFQNEKDRMSVFSRTNSLIDPLLNATVHVGPKYSAANKLPALQGLLPKTGNLQLNLAVAGVGHAPGEDVHLVILAFDYDRNRASFFRSSGSNGVGWGQGAATNITLCDAIHASTNAPVNYFDAPAAF